MNGRSGAPRARRCRARRRRPAPAWLLVASAVVSACAPGDDPTSSGDRPGEPWFEDWRVAADALVARASEVGDAYETVGPHARLDGDVTPDRRAVVRLDRAFERSGIVLRHRELPSTDDSVLAAFDFDGDDPSAFEAEASGGVSSVVSGGTLVVEAPADRELVAALPDPFAADLAVEIHLRARVRGCNELALGWLGGDAGDTVVLATPEDGEFRTFRIDGRSLFGSLSDTDVTHLTLRCPGPADRVERLEVDFLRIFSSPGMFRDRVAGVGRLTHGGENRPVLFARAGGVLQIPVEWPGGGAVVLDIGTSAIDATRALTVTLDIGAGDARRRLASLEIEPAASWTEQRITLDLPPGSDGPLQIRVDGDDGIALLSSPVIATPGATPRRVLFLVQDALRADHLTPYSASRPTSPFTGRLAGRGALFRRCLAQAPSTRMSVASYFTSLHPTATGVRTFDQVLADEYVTLAEMLRHRGWSTVSVIENSNAGPLAGLHQGFDRVIEVAEPNGTLEDLVPAVLDELPEGRPALVYVHLLDPHGPFDPPPEHRRWLEAVDGPVETVVRSDVFDPPWVTNPSRQGRVARYDGEIAANDRALAALFDRLEDLGWLDSTLVILASDHGEYLGEHGEWGHHSPGRSEVLHTPLVLIDRGRIPAGLVVDRPVQNLDLVPTILEMVGVDPGLLPFEGRSLVPLLRGEPQPPERMAFSEEPRRTLDIPPGRHAGAFAFGPRFVLHSPPIYHRLFDWNGPHVGSSSRRLSDPFASEISELFRTLHSEHLGIADRIAAGREQTVDVDAAAVEQLRALGYVADE